MSFQVLNMFHNNPGCWERHLQRKYNNPLFTDGTGITSLDVKRMQKKDQAELDVFDDAFKVVIEKALSLPPHAPSETILGLKEEIEKLYERAASLQGNQAEKQQALLKLNQVVMKTVRIGAGQDGFAQSQLNQEQIARDAHFALLNFSVVADLLREDSPIQPIELVRVLLIESKEGLQAALNLFDVDHKKDIHAQGVEILATLKKDDVDIPFAEDRLEEMAQSLDLSPQYHAGLDKTVNSSSAR